MERMKSMWREKWTWYVEQGGKQVFTTSQLRGWILWRTLLWRGPGSTRSSSRTETKTNSDRPGLLVKSTKFQVYHQEFGLKKLPTKWEIPAVNWNKFDDIRVDRMSCDISLGQMTAAWQTVYNWLTDLSKKSLKYSLVPAFQIYNPEVGNHRSSSCNTFPSE